MMAEKIKMRSQLELLKTLEGYVVNSVEVLYGLEGQVHVEISVRNPQFPPYGGGTKTVAFSIVEAS